MSDLKVWAKIFRFAFETIEKELEEKPRIRQRHIPSEPVDELAKQRARQALARRGILVNNANEAR